LLKRRLIVQFLDVLVVALQLTALTVEPVSAKSPNTAAFYLPVLVGLAALPLFL